MAENEELKRQTFQFIVLQNTSHNNTITTLLSISRLNQTTSKFPSLSLIYNNTNNIVQNAFNLQSILSNFLRPDTIEDLRNAVSRDFGITYSRITQSDLIPIINMDYFTKSYLEKLINKFRVENGQLNITFLRRYNFNPLGSVLISPLILFELFAQNLVQQLVMDYYRVILNTYADFNVFKYSDKNKPVNKVILYDI